MLIRSLLVVALLLFALDAGAQLAAQTDATNGVTVAVTPGNLGIDAKVWDFTIALDTHSQVLSDDLTESAVLVDDKGNTFKPLGWAGTAPGGHHRSGVIKFAPVLPRPQVI